MKWAIRLLFTLLLLAVFAIIGLAALILTLDINRLKPIIQTQLEKQDISATFTGDLSWTLYPSLAIKANDIALKHAQNNQNLAQIGGAVFSVKLMPLLQRNIEVNELSLTNSEIWYAPNTLELLSGNTTTAPATNNSDNTSNESESASQQINLAILKVAANNVTAHVTGADNTTSDFTIEQFTAYDINLEGQSFPLELKTTIALPQQPVIRTFAAGRIAISPSTSSLTSSELEATIELGAAQATQSKNAQLTVTTANTTLNWAQDLDLTTKLAISSPNVRDLLKALNIEIDTHNPQVLNGLEINSDVSLKQQQLALDNIKLSLDKTRATGNIKVNLAQSTGLPPTAVNLTIGEINVDDYLPTPVDVETAPIESAPTPLPIELINQLTTKASVSIESATVKKIAITKIATEIEAHAGNINIKKLNAKLFDGEINTNAVARTNNDSLAISGETKVKQLDLQKTLIHFADFKNIEGNANSTVQFSTSGTTDKQLTDNLSADTEATIPKLIFSPFNLEKQYCEALAWIEEKQGKTNADQNITAKQWQAYTQLEPVKLAANLRGTEVNVSTLSADIEKIQAAAKGTLNFATGAFSFPIDLSLANFSSAPDSCSNIDKKWRELSLPLICKGKLESIDAKTCLPDTKRINKIIEAKVNAKVNEAKEKAKAELDEKLEKEKAKLKEQADDKIKDALEDLKKDKKAKELEDKLKQLLGNGK